ncbi:MAG: DUF2007 domain-containing protein [Actinobacteria bacterium]|nr:DUF2007 domain-containing protein [Actinomycetota bacterium]
MGKWPSISRNEQGLVTIYSAENCIDAAFAKSMLDDAGIAYSTSGEGVQELEGLGSFGGFNPIFGLILIRVLEEDASRAREILRPLIDKTEVIDEETLIKLAEQIGNSEVEE